jgi:hypothetical protein
MSATWAAFPPGAADGLAGARSFALMRLMD